ncbi:MAG TPA: hypothetical protein VMC83_14280 [Streptosporangiaceae bacterium]|nr:hypothetical protein [Streptosporangiaceae bacterium]HUC25144.1 hypothetical protein [Streptosporangiaceae bacterium]
MRPGGAYFLINDGAKGCQDGAGDGQQQSHARGGTPQGGVEVAAQVADGREGSNAERRQDKACDDARDDRFLSFLISLMLGVQVATSEYAQRIATATFLTVPRRARVIHAKLVVAACCGALFWLIAVAVDGLVTPVFLQSQHLSASLAGWTVVRSVLLSLLAFVL